MNERKLGPLVVSPLGLGCMGMSYAYGPADESESLAVLRRYFELGGNFLDTAEIYGPYKNEELIARFLREMPRERVILATKFGFRIDPNGQITGVDSSAPNVRKACEGSLRRLGVDFIDLYYQHRVDPGVPIEETVGAMANLVREGKVRALGLSEAGVGTLRTSDRSSSNRRAPDRVFALVSRRRAQWHAGRMPRIGHRLRGLQPAWERVSDRGHPEANRSCRGRLAAYESALPGRGL